MIYEKVSSNNDLLNKGRELLNLGDEYFEKGNYESAICEYIKVMQTDQ